MSNFDDVDDQYDIGLTKQSIAKKLFSISRDSELPDFYKQLTETALEILRRDSGLLYTKNSNEDTIKLSYIECDNIKPSHIRSVSSDGKSIESFMNFKGVIFKESIIVVADNKEITLKDTIIFTLIGKEMGINGFMILGDLRSSTSTYGNNEERELIEWFADLGGCLISLSNDIDNQFSKANDKLEKIKEARNNLTARNKQLEVKRLGLTALGVVAATLISFAVMLLIRIYGLNVQINQSVTGKDLLYAMLGFTAFYAIVAISFKLITEINISEKSVTVKNMGNDKSS